MKRNGLYRNDTVLLETAKRVLLDGSMKLLSQLSLGLVVASFLLSTSPLPAQAGGQGAAAEVAKMRTKGGKQWKRFLSRFDVDGDKDISPAETARYEEWRTKRKALKDSGDTNGNGKIDPPEKDAFKQAVLDLNDEYFVNKSGSKGKKKGPGKKKGGADDGDDAEDDLSDIFGE